MADKLTLRGVKRIENYVEPAAIGDRVFSLKRPTTGKDQFTLKRWWTEQGTRNPKRYINATCLDGTFNGAAVVLAVVSNQDTRLEINLNDAGNDLVFGEIHSVERIAIFSSDLGTLHYDYIIPKIPGVAPAQLTIDAITTATTIGTVTLGGEQAPTDGDTETYTVSISGNATPTYVLTSSDTNDTVSGLDVTYSGSGTRTLTVTATDAAASDSPATGTLAINAAATTIGTVTLTGEEAPNDGDTETYTVSISGDASPTYVLTSSDVNDTVSGLDVTYSGAGTRTLTVTATDAAASDSPATGTLAINATLFFATRVANADYTHVVTQSGGYYYIDGVQQDTVTSAAGETIHFDLSDASLSGHPFGIYTDSSKTTQVTVGIEQEGTDLLFTPPIAGSFSYQCGAHANMGGDITVTN